MTSLFWAIPDVRTQKAEADPSTGEWGDYHALIIGINSYEKWPRLKTAVKDAEDLKDILIRDCGFQPDRVLLRTEKQATRSRIYQDLKNAVKSLGPEGNLLIYFAGHGQIDEETGIGYWIPVEGDLKDPSTWLEHSTVRSILSSDKVKGKNIILVADSCYAGALLRKGPSMLSLEDAQYQERLRELSNLKSRQVITSGGNEPVSDQGREGHSLFAYYFLRALAENKRGVIDLENLIHSRVWENVARLGRQRPSLGRLDTPMDEDGQFVLVRAVQEESSKKGVEEEQRRLEEEKRKFAEERAQFDAQRKLMEEQRRLDADKQKLAEEQRQWEAEQKRKAEEAKRKAEEGERLAMEEVNRLKAEQEQREAEKRAQEERERQKAAQTYKDATTGMEFLLVKGGCFDMGDTFGDGEANEKPVHQVCLGDSYLGKHEVTLGQFRQFVNDSGYRTEAEKGDGSYYWTGKEWKKDPKKNWRSPGFTQTDQHPVVCVSYNDALAFAEWLNKKSGKAYRLPTEAEWEYAARSGGKKYKYSWGNGSPSGNIADLSAKKQFSDWTIWEGYDDGYVYTAPVGSFRPNELGLFDLTGNVWEWVYDWYDEKYYSQSPTKNPQGPSSGQYRVVRGGSWGDVPRIVRASARGGDEPSDRFNYLGFRLALSAPQ